MKILNLLCVLSFALPFTPAMALDQCCFCIKNNSGEAKEKSTRWECETWFKDMGASCEYSQTLNVADQPKIRPTGVQCSKSVIYGAFDADSYMTPIPFEFSKAIAKSFHSSEVEYDGSSCLLFNNVDDVQRQARQLSTDKNTRYRISGNQNIGITTYIPIIMGPRENDGRSSKVTAIIQGGKSTLEYGECSLKGGKCETTRFSFGSNNDPNKKWCMNEDQLTEQTCCPNRKTQKETAHGRWSFPGEGC